MRIVPLLAKLSFGALVLSLVIGLTAALGTRFHLWEFPFGLLKLFPWCIWLGLAALVLGLAWLIASRIVKNNESARLGLIGLVGAAVVLYLPLSYIYTARTVPPIHDISTDTDDAPAFKAVLPLRTGAMNPPEYEGGNKLEWDGETMTAAEAQKNAYPDVKTVALLIKPDVMFQRAVSAARSMGWNIVAIDPAAGRIEATDTTLFFGFTDDIVIRVKPAGMGAKLDIRSKSRVGISDIGKNAARIRSFLKELASS